MICLVIEVVILYSAIWGSRAPANHHL